MATIEHLRIDDTDTVSRRRWPWVAAVALLLAVTAGGFTAFHILRERPDDLDSPDDLARGIAETQNTAESAPRPQPGTTAGITAGGYLEIIPPGPTVIAAAVEGPIQSVEVIEGQHVETGDVLIRLDDTLHRQELTASEAAVRLAEARLQLMLAGFRSEAVSEAEGMLRSVEARWRQAKADVSRNEQQVMIGGMPERELEVSRAVMDALEAEVAAARSLFEMRRAGNRPEEIAMAEAELAVAKIQMEHARWRVEACVIRAPASGVVLERSVQPGQWIQPSGSSAYDQGRTMLMTLADLSQLQAWIEVSQRDAGRVFVGQRVTLLCDALRDERIGGRVLRIMPKANLQRNTIQVKIEIPAPPKDLRPEMAVQATFEAAEASSDAAMTPPSESQPTSAP